MTRYVRVHVRVSETISDRDMQHISSLHQIINYEKCKILNIVTVWNLMGDESQFTTSERWCCSWPQDQVTFVSAHLALNTRMFLTLCMHCSHTVCNRPDIFGQFIRFFNWEVQSMNEITMKNVFSLIPYRLLVKHWFTSQLIGVFLSLLLTLWKPMPCK